MTREEQILNKAIDYSEIEENFLEYDDCGDVCDDKTFVEKAFIESAKWADKTMIEKVCEWLSLNMTDTVYMGCHGQVVLSKVDLIQGVKKAMEE
jgi:phosphoribulokinase